MKTILIAFCGLLLFGADASPLSTQEEVFELDPRCAKGQEYWCQDLAISKSCGAVTHCIQSVWTKYTSYPVDNDSICQICLDMVKQARDQLRSNETQEDLKAVFEGTCEFIRIKKIRQQCDKLADDLVPELVEALSSEMNPQVVCSVSGLCNNAAIDEELAKHSYEQVIAKKPATGLTCSQCNKVSGLIAAKFTNTDRDNVVQNMLYACGEMSSLSDGCAAIVLSNFNEVYNHLKESLNAENLCHMAGVCADQFHQHEEQIEVIADSQVGFIDHQGDDVPCDLCKQLIVHLRDVLVANTTVDEFKTVLEGICKQTKSFKSECLSLVDQYYDEIYAKLTHGLDPDGACFMIGICPKNLQGSVERTYEIAPLVPNSQLLMKKKVLGENEPVLSAEQVQSFQLPKDVLLLDADQIQTHVVKKKGNQQFCTLCEYFLHFLQDALASPINEENIKQTVLGLCKKVRKDFQPECDQFVDMYADAVIALLIQEIDPSEVCPRLNVCATKVAATAESSANEKCPLCLFLIQDVEEQLQRNKSKQNIENKLNSLCSRLRDDLKAECIDFVNTYTAELVDKLANDFTPREICLYLKLCTEKMEDRMESIGNKATYNDFLTNSVYQIEPAESSTPECLLCERLVKQVEKRISNNKSKEHIKQVLKEACASLPHQHLKDKCLDAIEKDTDFIVDLLIKEVTPKEVCLALQFCLGDFVVGNDDIVEVVPLPEAQVKPNEYTCRFCQIVVQKIEEQLNNKTAQEDVENCVKHVCDILPQSLHGECTKFIDAYAQEIIKHFPSESPQALCKKTCACENDDDDDDDDDTSQSDEIDGAFGSPECLLCEELVKEVEKKANNDKSKEHIKEKLEEACLKFRRKDLEQKCKEIVDKNADYIVNAIINNISPKQICSGLGLCDEPPSVDPRLEELSNQLMSKYSETPQCVICELIATRLEATLKNNATQAEIESAVRRVCSSLPAKFGAKCKKFIEDYADLVISLIATVPPKELCGELNFCRDNVHGDTSRQDVLECAICNTAVDAMDTVLHKNGPKEKQVIVDTACHLMPAQYYQQCRDFLNIYGTSVTTLLQRQEKKSEICVQVGKCYQDGDNSMFVEINQGISPSSDESQTSGPKKQLVGANECTYGPTYWCSNEENMAKCSAHKYCAEYLARLP